MTGPPGKELLVTLEENFSQAKCPSCEPMNGKHALNDKRILC